MRKFRTLFLTLFVYDEETGSYKKSELTDRFIIPNLKYKVLNDEGERHTARHVYSSNKKYTVFEGSNLKIPVGDYYARSARRDNSMIMSGHSEGLTPCSLALFEKPNGLEYYQIRQLIGRVRF